MSARPTSRKNSKLTLPERATKLRRPGVEALESRIAPAAVLSATKVDVFAPGGDVNGDGNFDPGDTILYTGHGGNDPQTGRQVADQPFDGAMCIGRCRLCNDDADIVRVGALGTRARIAAPQKVDAAIMRDAKQPGF